VPYTMTMTLLPILCLPLRAMWHCPLRQQIYLCDRQRSGQPEHDPPAGQCPRDVWSRLRQHDRFDRAMPARAIRRIRRIVGTTSSCRRCSLSVVQGYR
jgi:hypothetical protein